MLEKLVCEDSPGLLPCLRVGPRLTPQESGVVGMPVLLCGVSGCSISVLFNINARTKINAKDNTIMEIVTEIFRIYNLEHITKPKDQPDINLSCDDVPKQGEYLKIHFGKIPDHIIKGLIISGILAKLICEGKLESPSYTIPKELPPDFDGIMEAEFEKCEDIETLDNKWFLTIIFSKKILIQEEDTIRRTYYWISSEKIENISDSLKKYATDYINLIATILSIHLDDNFLQNKYETNISFQLEGQEPFCIPKFDTICLKRYEEYRTPMDFANVEVSLKELILTDIDRFNWLKPISDLRLASLAENDVWKRFLWTFLTLEILINKSYNHFYDQIIGNIGLKFNQHFDVDTLNKPLLELIYKKGGPFDLPLRAKFSSLALGLSPTTAAEDLEGFIQIKKFRDKLAHGELISPTDLPIERSDFLVRKYLDLILHYQINKQISF